MTDEKVPQVIFQAVNNHGGASGTPPYTNTSAPERYFGYYENEHEEQFIFIYDRERNQGTLLMGDNGWDKPIAIADPQKPNVVLSKNEWLWLQACWMAATAFERT